MINALEEIGAISRQNLYKIECGEGCRNDGGCEIILEDDTILPAVKRKAGPDHPGGNQTVRLSKHWKESVKDYISLPVAAGKFLFISYCIMRTFVLNNKWVVMR